MGQLDLIEKKPAEIELRPYQIKARQDLHASGIKGNTRILLQAPTGSGKTVIAAAILKDAVEQGVRVLFLAHRRELISQCRDKLVRFGVPSGVIMAGEDRSHNEMIQVASLQTLWVRGMKNRRMDMPECDLLVIDEAHRSGSMMYLRLIEHYKKAVLFGMTATPIRKDGKPLGNIYSDMVLCPSIAQLTAMGNLVPIRYFAPTQPDLAGIKVTAGDYNEKQLEARMDQVKLIGDVVENWARIARDRKTIVFASGVKHSLHLRDEFIKYGVKAEHIDGNTPYDERKKILNDLENGDLQVLTNCGVLNEGWDSPATSCCILARPTKSLGLYIQMSGRILRPSDGKKDAILIDHSGAVYDHGRIDEFTDWSLDSGMTTKIEKKQAERKERKPITCQKCKALYFGQRHCPECGHIPQTFPKGVEYKDGFLVEIDEDGKHDPKVDAKLKLEWYRMLKGYAISKGKKPGLAHFKFKEKFGKYPSNAWSNMGPLPPSPDVLRWIKYQNIKWAKSRNNPVNLKAVASILDDFKKPAADPRDVALPEKAPSHGLLRKEMMAGDAYQPEEVEWDQESFNG